MAEYIEREALLAEMRVSSKAAYLVVMDAPAADVAPVVRGEWELHKDGSGTCKRCHTKQKAVWDIDRWQNYCGHCGADMREGRDGEREKRSAALFESG